MTKEVSFCRTSHPVIAMFIHLIFVNLQLNIYINSKLTWTKIPVQKIRSVNIIIENWEATIEVPENEVMYQPELDECGGHPHSC